MTQQEFQLHIWELDNAMNQRCEPIRKEIDRVHQLLDEARIERDSLTLQLDAAKKRVSEAQFECGKIRREYDGLKDQKRIDAFNSGKTQDELDRELNVLNVSMIDAMSENNKGLKQAHDDVAYLKERYGQAKLRIHELTAQVNKMTAEVKAICREAWNEKHAFILANPKCDIEGTI